MKLIAYGLRLILVALELTWCGILSYDLIHTGRQVATAKIVKLVIGIIFGAIAMGVLATHPPE
jgi:hypothetical protein